MTLFKRIGDSWLTNLRPSVDLNNFDNSTFLISKKDHIFHIENAQIFIYFCLCSLQTTLFRIKYKIKKIYIFFLETTIFSLKKAVILFEANNYIS